MCFHLYSNPMYVCVCLCDLHTIRVSVEQWPVIGNQKYNYKEFNIQIGLK